MPRKILGPFAVCIFLLAASYSNAQVVDHAFSFDMRLDAQDAEVLDYRYGDSKLPVARNPEYLLKKGVSLQFTNIMGPMQRGDSLYVKWRTKSTGQVYEDTVDLRERFPADIKDHRIEFMIRGEQLYVYLISPEARPSDMPLNGPRIYRSLKTTTIYPDQPKK